MSYLDVSSSSSTLTLVCFQISGKEPALVFIISETNLNTNNMDAIFFMTFSPGMVVSF